MAGRQRQRRPDQAQKYQTTHKPGTRQRHTGRKKPGHRTQKPPQQRQKVRPSDREQSSGTPAEKGRAFRELRVKKQKKSCALCAQRTNDKQAPGQRRPNTKEAGGTQAGHKSGRRRVGRKTTPQKADTIAASLTHGRPSCSRENTPRHRAQKPSQQRQAAQERPARHMARHIGRRKTPPNRQNSRSLFCLPGGAL